MRSWLLICLALPWATAASNAAASSALPTALEAAYEALDAWQLEDARDAAERLLQHAPDDAQVQLLVAEVLHQEGRHSDAVALWRSAGRQAGPRHARIGPQLLASAAYAPHLTAHPTPHFVIMAMDKDTIVATYAADVLESAYQRIGHDLQFMPAERGEKIVVEIYPDARGLAGATGLTVKEIETSGTIAVCKFHRLMITSPLAAIDGYAWADTLAHEFVHLVVSKRSHDGIPIWLHEGIAKYFESRWKGRAGQALTPYAEKLLARAIAKQKFITLKQMHPSMAKLPSQDDAALAFAEVFTLIEYIVDAHGTQAIATILRRVGAGQPLEDALQAVLHMPLGPLEAAWKQALGRRKLRSLPDARPDQVRLGDATANPGGAPVLEPMADKQVHDWARLGELLQLRGRPRAAIVEYERALAASGLRYASLVTLLARAYIDVDRLDDAEKLLRRSLAQHPDDGDAHLLAGRLALKRQAWDLAQAHFEATRLHNPFNPEVHAALAGLYSRRGDAARSTQEEQFLALCQKPRPPHDTTPVSPTAPAPAGDSGLLRVVGAPWGPVTIDGGDPALTPRWDVPLPAGGHHIEDRRSAGAPHEVQITAGHSVTLKLDRAEPSAVH
jgi:tetratricopeptide (TPR) repeat protein